MEQYNGVENMKWDNSYNNLDWQTEITNYKQKLQAAKQVAKMVNNGDVIGFGSGSTSFLAVKEIAKKLEDKNIKIKAIPTSREIYFACVQLGIPIITLNEERPDWTFDGADEVDPNNNLIKGRGGAMFNEKLVMSSSSTNYIIVDDSKLVASLGSKFPIPVEVHPNALMYVKSRIGELSPREMRLRLARMKDGPIITENGNFILDIYFDKILYDLEGKLKAIPGVIESGLFIGYNVNIIKVE